MDVDFILKIAGMGMIVAVGSQILSKIGRDDQGNLLSVAGFIVVLFLLFGELATLIETVRDVFGI